MVRTAPHDPNHSGRSKSAGPHSAAPVSTVALLHGLINTYSHAGYLWLAGITIGCQTGECKRGECNLNRYAPISRVATAVIDAIILVRVHATRALSVETCALIIRNRNWSMVFLPSVQLYSTSYLLFQPQASSYSEHGHGEAGRERTPVGRPRGFAQCCFGCFDNQC